MTLRYGVEASENALADLRDIYGWLASQGSVAVADAFLEKVLERVASLEQFPERGAVPDEMTELGVTRYRQMSFSPYRMFYRVIDDRVIITVFADGRRDIADLLRQRLLTDR
jgi:toxin ParE1/3/4